MMARVLVLLIYNLLQPLVLLLMAPGALRKMKARGGKPGDLGQRFGHFTKEQLSALGTLRQRGQVWWIHAVSVGEVGIAKKLVEELFVQRPDLGIVLTTTTPTAHQLAMELATAHPDKAVILYSALDGWFTVRRFLKAISPVKLVLVEAEVWPNLVFAAKRRGVSVALINARLSPRSEARYIKFKAFVQPVFCQLDCVCVQEPEDVERWRAIGFELDHISHTGSVKFDMRGQPEPVAKVAAFRGLTSRIGWSSDAPVLLAASTHDGEEAELAKLTVRLRSRVPALRLIIVPRHVERSDKVEADIKSAGLSVTRRSTLNAEATDAPPADALLVDTTGELRAWQYLASVVVVGKSFLAKGGQNPAEAVMAGKPVVFGPHMENFEALVKLLLSRQGAVQVSDFAEAETTVERLLNDPSAAQRLALNGQQALQAHAGSTQRTVERLLK
jgi:3-deoxy-D-manno-octulosonic-acid transferase